MVNAYLIPIKLEGVEEKITVTIPDGDEEAVFSFLWNYRDVQKLRISQLVHLVKEAGAHRVHEKKRRKTTTRRMYQLIRNLREGGVPIVGDKEGVWIAKNDYEVVAFADHLEHKAKADIASMMYLRNKMLEIVQVKRTSLFDGINLDMEEDI